MVMKFKDLEYKTFVLKSVDDIVKYDFIAQKSISYLDLNNSEYSRGNKFVNTHEGFRKAVHKERKVIYKFHLDFPVLKEKQLKKVEQFKRFTPALFLHVSEVHISDCTHSRFKLVSAIECAIEKSTDKLKTVRKYLKAMKTTGWCKLIYLFGLCTSFLDVLIEESDDSSLVVDFLQVCNPSFIPWFICKDTGYLQYILHHSHRMRLNYLPCDSVFDSPLKHSLCSGKLSNVMHILKYGDFGRKHRLEEDRDL